ncbi:GCN5-related N-acetyltransferase [Alteracholeplasma palmae J233]|uniref:GCN5-related N-acetyltransferase n=1 Tax=Alteracholeplasma palmae (strain ATCC 49389 / J233) TaxID=1318466 RepID=U4KL11_ALTPJ|nr:GNAT family protein [Alteracholeplasma palmae]CCV64544.1 GCN5-related N-acetyltransferase [Alteracholeplasma palmae J233]
MASSVLFSNYMLRDIQLDDYKDLFEYGSDYKVIKLLSWGPYLTKTEAYDTIKYHFLERPKRGLPVGYAIVDLKLNKMIGTLDFHTIHPDNTVEIGYVLNSNYWNQGIMKKAVSKLIKIGFFQLNYETLLIGHAESNLASMKVIKANHFKLIEIKKMNYYNRFEQEYEDTYWYQLTKKEYENDYKG